MSTAREPKWAYDVTMRDLVRKTGVDTSDMVMSYHKLYGWAIQHDDAANSSSAHVLGDYLYERYGRPKWFVDQEVFGLLTTLEIDDRDLTGIFFPHDVFTLIFERGTVLGDRPLRSIMVLRLAASLTFKFISEAFRLDDATRARMLRTVTFLVDYGEDGTTGLFSWDTRPEVSIKTHQRRLLHDPDRSAETIVKTDAAEVNHMRAVTQIIVSALLYQAARPDCVAEYTLPRACRYSFKGEPKTYRRLLCPKPAHAAVGGAAGVATGRTVTGHYRGWVLRTLRAERYKRNPDGTFKVILVEPCAVAGGPQEV